MVLDSFIEIKVNNRYSKYYKDIGYDISLGTIIVKIEDLMITSQAYVNVKCDYCGYITKTQYRRAISKQKYCCNGCNSSSKESIINKYGVENVFQNEEIKEKIFKTNIEKYGFKSPMQNTNIKEKTKLTNIEKYGVENIFQNEEIKENIRNYNIKKYGVEYSNQREEVKEKIFKTNIEKYGFKSNAE